MNEVDRVMDEMDEFYESLDNLKDVKRILESDIETRILPNQGYPYIPASSLRNRLNEAFSLRWSTKVLSSEIIEDTVLILLRLTVKIGDIVIIKEDFGSASLHRFTYGKNEGKFTNPGDGYSNAIFDALKSCAKAFGIGNTQMDVYKDAKGNYVQHSQKPTTNTVVKPAAKPAAKPVVKPMVKPAAKPAAKPAVKPTVKPTVKPAAKPAAKPAVKPTVKPAAKSVVVKESIDPKVAPVEPQLAPVETAPAPVETKPVVVKAPVETVPAPVETKPVVVKAPVETAPTPVETKPVVVKAPVETKQPEAYSCPGGGTFGVDNDNFGECDSCTVYNLCCKEFFEKSK